MGLGGYGALRWETGTGSLNLKSVRVVSLRGGVREGEVANVEHDVYEVIFGKQHAGMFSSQVATTRRLANSLILLTYLCFVM